MGPLTKMVTFRASSEQTAGSETGTVANGGEIKCNDIYEFVTLLLDVTAAADDVDDTLDVYVDTSYDGGTTWINLAHFSQVLGNGGTKRHLLNLHQSLNAEIDVTDDLAAGNVRSINHGDRIRYRATVADGGDADAAFTWSLTGYACKGN